MICLINVSFIFGYTLYDKTTTNQQLQNNSNQREPPCKRSNLDVHESPKFGFVIRLNAE